MEEVSFARCARAKAESSELHFWMMLSGADGLCFPPIPRTTVHPEILGGEGLKKQLCLRLWILIQV